MELVNAVNVQRVICAATKHREAVETQWLVEISKDRKSIQIFREEKDGSVTVCKKFSVGDIAEYDSYNLSYTGTIESITEKSVTFWTGYNRTNYGVKTNAPGTKKEIKRLKLDMFCWRNHNFDLETTRKNNAETSMYI